MKKLFFSSLLILINLSLIFAQSNSTTIAQKDFKGWNSYQLSNKYLAVNIVPEIGGRMINFSLNGFNFLWVNPDLLGCKPTANGLNSSGGWLNYGGEKLWPAPQGWDTAAQWPGPPDGILDGSAHQTEVNVKNGVIKLISKDDPYTGICFSREISAVPGSSIINIKATMTNITVDRDVRWGIWSVAQMNGTNDDGSMRTDLQSINPSDNFKMLYGAVNNPQFTQDKKNGMVITEYKHFVGKIGMINQAGWCAALFKNSGMVFVQQFKYEKEKEYPDASNVEIWTQGLGSFFCGNSYAEMSKDPAQNPYYMEMELLSPFAKLKPSESYSYTYSMKAAKIPAGETFSDCNETAVISTPLSIEKAQDKLTLNCSFGSFYEGYAVAVLESKEGKRLYTGTIAKIAVSPEKECVYGITIQANDKAVKAALILVKKDGTEIGIIAERTIE